MSDSSSQRVAKNTFFLYVRMLFVMLINIFSVRFVLKGLGVVDYGIFDVVAGLVTMFSSLSSIISTASLRFHSYAIGEGKPWRISEIFTVSFNIFALLALIVLLIGELFGIWFINTKADIPIDRVYAANWLFQFTMASFVVGLVTAPFSALVFAFERMSLFSLISISECTLKFLLAYSIGYLFGDHLIIYGLGLLIIQTGLFCTYYAVSRQGDNVCYYKRHVDKSLYKQILSFSGWTLFSSSAGIGIAQLVTFITNVFFGPVVNAARAIAFQVNGAMTSFTGNIIMAIKPPMIKQYAEGDYEKVNRYFNFSNKVILFSLLLILLPIYFGMEIVLKIWLDVSDTQTVLFCRLILIYALVLSLNNPIAIIIQATGDIRSYSIFVEIPTLLCFPVTWGLYALGLPAETSFMVMIVAIIISHIIRLIFLKKQFHLFSYREYLLSFVLPSFIIILVVSCCLYTIRELIAVSVIWFIVSFVIGAIVLCGLALLFGFNRYEKETLLRLLHFDKMIKRHKGITI